MNTTITEIDDARLRGMLAERRISHTEFARVCGLNRAYLGRILCGTTPAGELALIKIERGLRHFGLDKEYHRAR